MKVKTCTKCGVEKPETDFAWKNRIKGKRQSVCKPCIATRSNQWYYANKESHLENVMKHKIINRQKARQHVYDYLLCHPCAECGETDPVVLEFHHIQDKDADVARLVTNGVSIARIQDEIDKCQVLCSNCHRRKTAKERGWYLWK